MIGATFWRSDYSAGDDATTAIVDYARRVEGEQLRENRKLSQRLAELQRAMEEATARAASSDRAVAELRESERRAAGDARLRGGGAE